MGRKAAREATLAFRDEYVALEELESVSVTDDPVAVVDLEKACPPDDVAEVGLAEMSRALVTLNELDEPTAGAGYDEWEQIIAHLGVLTPPPFRRRGFGLRSAALATNEALDSAWCPSGDPGSRTRPPEGPPPGWGSSRSARRPRSCWRLLRPELGQASAWDAT